MNFGRTVLTFAAGLLVFGAILLAENARFEFKNSIEDPFQKAIDVERIDFDAVPKGEVTEILSTDFEFFRFYPGSKIDFNDGKREIISGPIFISTQFVSEKDTKRAEQSFDLSFKDSGDFTPQVALFKLGKFYINMPRSSVFITRDKKKKRTRVYAVNHSIDLFFKNAETPFTLPSNMFLDIHDDLITDKTGSLYYTKLKKELRMQPFIVDLSVNADTLNDDTTEVLIAKSIKSKNNLHFKMKNFAQKIPHTWIWFESDGILGSFIGFIKKAQATLAIGYPEGKKRLLQFNEIVKPFVLANKAVEENDTEKAQRYLDEFSKGFEKKLWFKLLLDTEIEQKWTLFKNAHKAWLRNLFPDDPAQVFVKFWNKKNATSSLSGVESMFSSIELLVANNHYQEAFERISDIKKEIKKINITAKDQVKVTKLRRLLFELQKERLFFQRNEIFELYGYLVNKEMIIAKGEKKEELALESAQDILFFLNKFINRSDKSEVSSTLVKIFNLLNIESITKKRGRRIFTTTEFELIKTIGYIGSSGLTKEIIASINNKKKYEKILKEQELSRIKGGQDGTESARKNLVRTIVNLIDYLESFEINTRNIKITRTANGFKFVKAQFERFPVSGQFNIKTQKFDILTVGNESEKGLSKRPTIGFLAFVRNKAQDMSSREQGSSGGRPTRPPLKTQRAILERDSVRRYFDAKDIKIEMDNIIPLDFNYNLFQITEATYKNESRMNFLYLKKQDVVENLVLSTGWVTQEIKQQISRERLPAEIDKVIDILSRDQIH